LSRRTLAAAALATAGAALFPIPADAAHRGLGTRTLAEGAKGWDVRVLQDFLTRTGVGTPIDGRFGSATRVKLRTWERRKAPLTRVDGRLSRAEAPLLRQDVEAAEASRAPAPAPAPAAAPASAGEQATIAADGKAVAPASAPEPVKAMIAAANAIHAKPYRYGGGHSAPPNRDSGYDCSGSMSYAMQGADLLDTALDSSGFARYGDSGPGQWVTIYANAGHSYMVIAGLRFDTSGRKDAGSRWQTMARPSAGYSVRHPPGL